MKISKTTKTILIHSQNRLIMTNTRNLVWVFLVAILAFSSCSEGAFYPDNNTDDSHVDDGHNHSEGEEGALTLYQVNGNDISKITDYNVTGQLKQYQEDYTKHLKMWEYFTQLIPQQDRDLITEFEIFYGENETLGYVAPINDNDLSKWKMGLAIEVVADLEKIDLNEDFAYTIIHELGHVLTLNHLQLDASVGEESCNTFHIGEGCSESDSYLYELFNIGWSDIIDEANGINNDRQAQRFHDKYSDRFVTDYAATNPAEDIAEVFAVFVVQDNQPTGNTIADQKIKAMYGRPDLVRLRSAIRQQTVVRTMQPGKWKHSKHKAKKAHLLN